MLFSPSTSALTHNQHGTIYHNHQLIPFARLFQQRVMLFEERSLSGDVGTQNIYRHLWDDGNVIVRRLWAWVVAIENCRKRSRSDESEEDWEIY